MFKRKKKESAEEREEEKIEQEAKEIAEQAEKAEEQRPAAPAPDTVTDAERAEFDPAPPYENGLYRVGDNIPAGTYTGQDYDTLTSGVKCLVIVNADMDESLVYDMCKTMNENSADLAAGNAILNEMTDPSFLCTNMPIPLHSGAEKYYSELGLLEA